MQSKFTIYRRNNGVFYIRFIEPETKRFRYISTRTKIKSEALEFLANLKQKIEEREKQKQKPILLSEFISQILNYAKANFERSTFLLYRSAFKNFLQIIGDKPLGDITAKEIDLFKIERLKKVSKAKVSIDLRCLKAGFNRAILWGYISSNPCKGVEIPKQEPSILYFSRTEFEKLISLVKEGYMRDIILFAVSTGLRLNEILNLTWADVDFEERIIKIKNKPTFRTKTGKERIVPLNDVAFTILKNRFSQITSEKIFPFSKFFVSHKFKEYVRLAGLNPKFRFHSLRHTFATWLISSGVSIYEVSKLLGHSDIKTTEIYAHLSVSDLKKAVEKIQIISN